MKESDITQPVIDKCKQIAEHWRMEIYTGGWYLLGPNNYIKLSYWGHRKTLPESKDFTPIPSIFDCLEKLRELKWCIETSWIMEPRVRLDYVQPKEESKTIKTTGDTLHEALLSALLGVLEEAK